ncbi:MAG TPA: type II toxin-antitoxin system death-on-curing family toxin [Ferruginibacter sp.]|nr:type II toxin-antitoxin system death-on-curing family toxin [Ferruginibacter sp.]HMP22285.1 type II toxin-antitoxin system death-on-curing family toxin [Ferruginibacter sp.]
MISLKEATVIHEILIDNFGGLHGIRDFGSLESALNRPLQSFDNQELYPGAINKAAALLESILVNHPFIDGNKRTGYTLVRLFLLKNEIDIKATQEEKYDFIMSVASGTSSFNSIVEWLTNHATKNN